MTTHPDDLLSKIERHMAARQKVLNRMAQLERKIQYRNKRIRQLSVQRKISLNLTLPI